MITPAWVMDQRPNGYADALLTLADMLARHPDESVCVTGVYRSKRKHGDPWYRVSVRVGFREAFAPRFVAHDDATSFRQVAQEMATSREG